MSATLILRVRPELKVRCQDVADEAGLSLSDWVRAVLARAANEGAFAPPKGDAHGKKREG